MSKKIKILWYDRNDDIFDFKLCLKNTEHLEFLEFGESQSAIEALLNDKDINLVISGNYKGEGLEIFKELERVNLQTPFLLFSGDLLSDYTTYMDLEQFNYLPKYSYTPEAFQKIVDTLVNKTVRTNDSHMKLSALRTYFGYSVEQFASIIKVPVERVMSFETETEIPSHYIVNVCNIFDLPLNFFASSTYADFKSQLTSQLGLKKNFL